MKLLIERLTAAPSEHHFETPSGWWEHRVGTRASRGLETGSLSFDLHARTLGGNLHLEGNASGELETQCGRCLARYRQVFADTFRLVLEPAGERTPSDPQTAETLARDGMSLGDDFETGWFASPEIQLDSFLEEVVSLAIPIQLLCREDCAGLCPRCGCDRNRTNCDCEELKPESPFAVLAALRGG